MQMKCVQVLEIGKFQLTKVALRKPLDHEVVIKVSVTGLCRTDLKLIRVGHRDLVLPRIPGEEVVGTVCETGSAVAGIQTGDLVYVYPGSPHREVSQAAPHEATDHAANQAATGQAAAHERLAHVATAVCD